MAGITPEQDARLQAAIREWDASSQALREAVQTETAGRGEVVTRFDALLQRDQAARVQYAEAQLAVGWSVPAGLLHDVAPEQWPVGYERYA